MSPGLYLSPPQPQPIGEGDDSVGMTDPCGALLQALQDQREGSAEGFTGRRRLNDILAREGMNQGFWLGFHLEAGVPRSRELFDRGQPSFAVGNR